MTVYRPAPPVRLRAQIQGLYLDHWSGPSVTYTAYGCYGGSLTVTLLSDRDLHPRPLRILARAGANVLARFTYKPGIAPRTMTVPLEGKAGVCPVTFSIPTAVPQLVTGRPDTRALGVRFLHFAYSPKRANFPAYVEISREESPRGRHALRVLPDKKDFTIASLISAAYDSWSAPVVEARAASQTAEVASSVATAMLAQWCFTAW